MTPLSPAPQRVPVRRITPAGAWLQAWWSALSVPAVVEQVQPSRVGPDRLSIEGLAREAGIEESEA